MHILIKLQALKIIPFHFKTSQTTKKKKRKSQTKPKNQLSQVMSNIHVNNMFFTV